MIKKLVVLVVIAAMFAAVVVPAGAVSIGTKALRGVAIGYAVKQSAGALDKFINTITFQKGLSSKLDTKVVPVLSVGDKGYVGGAQVTGPAKLIKNVKAVFQYEQNFDNGRYRIKALVPSSSLNPLQLKRVEKIGVSAVIDVALAGGLSNEYYSGSIKGGEVLRAAAVAVGVKAASKSIDKFVNTITFNKNAVTAVVPMASFGEKAYVGGAQVASTGRIVDKVAAVWQYEDLFSSGKFRVKVLVPTNSSNPLKMKRVDGAGVTAVIDTSIADQKEKASSKTRSWYTNGRDYRPGNDREYKKDNGLHKGWEIGKHKGWDKKNKDKDKDSYKKLEKIEQILHK
ncbi:MAG: hypothetical protein ABFD64_02440 [Armatimonadota bacterium]